MTEFATEKQVQDQRQSKHDIKRYGDAMVAGAVVVGIGGPLYEMRHEIAAYVTCGILPQFPSWAELVQNASFYMAVGVGVGAGIRALFDKDKPEPLDELKPCVRRSLT